MIFPLLVSGVRRGGGGGGGFSASNGAQIRDRYIKQGTGAPLWGDNQPYVPVLVKNRQP